MTVLSRHRTLFFKGNCFMKETDVADMRTSQHRQMATAQSRARHKRLRQRRKRQRQAAIMVVVLILLLAVLVGLIVHMTRRDELRGTWTLDQVTAYEFDGKGHGALLLPQKHYEFDYTIDGKCLYIDFRDPTAEDTSYTYETSKDTLLLTNDNGQEYQFMRRR